MSLRMRICNITQSDVAKAIGVTRAAVSHVFSNAKQSSLVPKIEAFVIETEKQHYADAEARRDPSRLQPTDDPLEQARRRVRSHRVMLEYPDPYRSPDAEQVRSEIEKLFGMMTDFSRRRLLERARVLLGVQMLESSHERALDFRRLQDLIQTTEAALADKKATMSTEKREQLMARLEQCKKFLANAHAAETADDRARREDSEERALRSLEEVERLLSDLGIPASSMMNRPA